MDETEKAHIYEMDDAGEISEHAARQLLGDAFEDAEPMTRGAELMLSGDTSRFLTPGEDE